MNITKFLKNLGPGLLYAGAAVGVSHLVQSTRAGASYGYELVWILIFANIFKYPFFEFAPRYATSTGKSLIDGYKKLGNWALILYILLTVSTMFAISAAILMVTSGLLANILGVQWSVQTIVVVLILVIVLLLFIGKFKLLEGMMKYIILLLSISTILAVSLAFKTDLPQETPFNWYNAIDFAFLVAFIGWMPAPFDVSVWYSAWTVAKQESSTEKISMKSALRDFNIGYIGTAVLALGFLMLGALVMYGSGEAFSSKGVAFAGQLINMYTQSLGSWAYYLIGIAAFTTMMSTSITILDAYPRVLGPSFKLLSKKESTLSSKMDSSYVFWMIIVILGTLALIFWFAKNMKFMVDLATTISFVTAPILAILNFIVVMKLPKNDQPGKYMIYFSWLSIILLTLFSVFYLIWKFI